MSTASFEGLQPAASKWVDKNKPWQSEVPNQRLEILLGSGEVISEGRESTKHKYAIEVKERVLVKDNTIYFPGWELWVDGSNRDMSYEDARWPGVIVFELEEGRHLVELIFRDTFVRRYSFYFSISIWLVMGILMMVKKDDRIGA